MALTLWFADQRRSVAARGYVVFEKRTGTHALPAGVGVRFCQLSAEDHRFMLAWLDGLA